METTIDEFNGYVGVFLDNKEICKASTERILFEIARQLSKINETLRKFK